MPEAGADALLVGAEIVMALQSVVSRRCGARSGAVVSVTEFLTDGQRNVLAGTATLDEVELDLREPTSLYVSERSVRADEEPQRVLSIGGAITEIVYALTQLLIQRKQYERALEILRFGGAHGLGQQDDEVVGVGRAGRRVAVAAQVDGDRVPGLGVDAHVVGGDRGSAHLRHAGAGFRPRCAAGALSVHFLRALGVRMDGTPGGHGHFLNSSRIIVRGPPSRLVDQSL